MFIRNLSLVSSVYMRVRSSFIKKLEIACIMNDSFDERRRGVFLSD